MPEPLTFDISLRGADWVSIRATPSRAAYLSRGNMHDIRPSRPIVAEDFRDYGQRCDLSVLGYSSRDFRQEWEPYVGSAYVVTGERDRLLNDAYASLSLDRVREYSNIGEWCRGINGIRTEQFNERLHALDEAVLDVYRRRAVV